MYHKKNTHLTKNKGHCLIYALQSYLFDFNTVECVLHSIYSLQMALPEAGTAKVIIMTLCQGATHIVQKTLDHVHIVLGPHHWKYPKKKQDIAMS